MQFLFGKYSLRIDGDKDILGYLGSRYPKYLSLDEGSFPDGVLRFEAVSDNPSDRNLNEGWNLIAEYGCWQLSYSENKKVRFALRKETTFREINVFINRKSDALIGAQYGAMLALAEQCVGLHGVTVLCGNKIVVLSAPSATGKTTLSHLLEQYEDAIVINGDFALLSVSEEGVCFEPTPFCGSSERALNHRFRIDHVVFLEQSQENRWRDLTGREALTSFLSNSFVPANENGMRQTVHRNIAQIIPQIRVSSFAFAPVPEAAKILINRI